MVTAVAVYHELGERARPGECIICLGVKQPGEKWAAHERTNRNQRNGALFHHGHLDCLHQWHVKQLTCPACTVKADVSKLPYPQPSLSEKIGLFWQKHKNVTTVFALLGLEVASLWTTYANAERNFARIAGVGLPFVLQGDLRGNIAVNIGGALFIDGATHLVRAIWYRDPVALTLGAIGAGFGLWASMSQD